MIKNIDFNAICVNSIVPSGKLSLTKKWILSLICFIKSMNQKNIEANLNFYIHSTKEYNDHAL